MPPCSAQSSRSHINMSNTSRGPGDSRRISDSQLPQTRSIEVQIADPEDAPPADEYARSSWADAAAFSQDNRARDPRNEQGQSVEAAEERAPHHEQEDEDPHEDQLMHQLLGAVMVDYQGLPLPEVAVKLKNLLHIQQLPADGMLYDGYRMVCTGLRDKPLVADLPGVACCFSDDDKLPRIDITDSMLDSVEEYLKGSTTTAGLPGARLLRVFKENGSVILSQSVKPVVYSDRLKGDQEPPVDTGLMKLDDLRDIILTSARTFVMQVMPNSVADSILGAPQDLRERLEQLQIIPTTEPFEVAWRLSKPDGSVVLSSRSPRYSLWMRDENKLLVTVPKAYASGTQEQYMRHVQETALELARFLFEHAPWCTLEARVIAKRLRDVVSWDLFRRDFPIRPASIRKLFKQCAADAERLAGSPHDCHYGYRSPVRSYFIAMEHLL